ncbi:MAG: flagellar export chaperone FliS [Pseudomonadales bacterium]|uniref:Flagellar secretion chaperone FliS n=1 Tax=Oleiphilus messinensis TaxID=141451 RepID=A0A1Y0ICP5_9GAMM|nr:flagellar export chaperone FliS [Oleiphilus messinensis]ARU57153.1 flagellar protein FliS [Oleiphilus messinensis]MCG8613604.1 flagellar export chaperone FliS [Pseudomonadales bacterium]
MNAAHQYQQVSTQTSIVDADPHKLIQLLLDGALQRMAMAKNRITAADFEAKNNLINKSIEIVAGLRGFLDFEKGGEVAANLEALYDYIERRLFEANVKNSLEILDECSRLIRSVKEGWDGIRQEVIEKKLV